MAFDGNSATLMVVAGGVVIVGVFALGAIVMRTQRAPAFHASAATPSAEPATTPAVAPPRPLPPTMPLSFADTTNEPRYEKGRATLAALRSDLVGGKPVTDLRKRCGALDSDVAPLAGESHPSVKGLLDGVRRTCDCDVPLSLLRSEIARARAGKKLQACKAGDALTKELYPYRDDPEVQPVLAAFGLSCS